MVYKRAGKVSYRVINSACVLYSELLAKRAAVEGKAAVKALVSLCLSVYIYLEGIVSNLNYSCYGHNQCVRCRIYIYAKICVEQIKVLQPFGSEPIGG